MAEHETTAAEVLIAYAGRAGSTAEIAAAVASELATHGLSAEVMPCRDVTSLTPYGAVVLGSALYLRRWEPEAIDFLNRFGAALAERPTWTFQSGPCGTGADAEQVDPPRRVNRLVRRWGLRAPVTFGGRLDAQHVTGVIGRWAATSPSLAGDFRDWARIRAWAAQLAVELGSPASRGGFTTDRQVIVAAGERHLRPHDSRS
jgi:menaquinone-dependent protoporphyrinogen oxidase